MWARRVRRPSRVHSFTHRLSGPLFATPPCLLEPLPELPSAKLPMFREMFPRGCLDIGEAWYGGPVSGR
jgi:hypothetical protein